MRKARRLIATICLLFAITAMITPMPAIAFEDYKHTDQLNADDDAFGCLPILLIWVKLFAIRLQLL